MPIVNGRFTGSSALSSSTCCKCRRRVGGWVVWLAFVAKGSGGVCAVAAGRVFACELGRDLRVNACDVEFGVQQSI